MPRRLVTLTLIGSAGALLLAGAATWALGPGGPWLVSHVADGRRVWRLGVLHVERVSGASLGDLRIGRATLSDAQGVWLEANGLTLRWRPLALLRGYVDIPTAGGDAVRVLRRPALSAPTPAGKSPDVSLGALSVTDLRVESDAFGAAADFAVQGALRLNNGAATHALLSLTGVNGTRDGAHLALDGTAPFNFRLGVDGPQGGFFARALGTRDPVRLDASARGDDAAGAGKLVATVGTASLAAASLDWTKAGWRAEGDARFSAAPALAPLVRAVGRDAHVRAEGGRAGDRRFSLHAIAPDAALDLTRDAAGKISVAARAAHLEAFTPGVSGGAAMFEGAASHTGDVTTFDGTMQVTHFRSGVVETDLAGPVTVRVTHEAAEFTGDAALSRPGGAEVMQRLLGGSHLSLKGRWDRRTHRFAIASSLLDGPKARLTASGALGAGAQGLKGRWRIADARAIYPRFAGAVAGDFALTGGFSGKPFALSVRGDGDSLSAGLGPLDPLLGGPPRLEGQFSIHHGVTTVERMTATGPRLRLGARGRFVGANADLAIEAAAKGPAALGPLTLDGAADATGTVKGPLSAFTLELQTRLGSIDAGGLVLASPIVTLHLAPAGAGQSGRIDVVASAAGAPVRGNADLDVASNAISFTNVRADVAGLTARGEVTLSDNGPAATLAIEGVADRIAAPLHGEVNGTLSLTPRRKASPALAAQLRLTNGRVQALSLRNASATANGTLDNLSLRASLLGAASGAVVDLDLTGQMSHTGDATRLSVRPSGAIADASVSAAAPVLISFSPSGAEAQGDVRFGDGSAQFRYADKRNALSLNATLDNAPLAPIAALFGEEMNGRATGMLIASGDGALNGSMDIQITDALLQRRARDPVSMKVTGRIAGGALTLNATAVSRNGLDAAIEGTAPVNARARPLRIALAGDGKATWRAKGPAEALWGLVGSLDQNVSGDLNGQGSLRFSVGRLSGQGGLELSNGRFADRKSGIDLRDIAASIKFNSASARLVRFFAHDARGGEVTGTGEAQGLASGRVDLVAKRVRLLGRPEAQATGSGPLSLVWTKDGAKLTGDLTLDTALLSPSPRNTEVADLPVIEINRPDGALPVEAPTPERAGALPRTALDVRVRAPGRVFVRGRGLDSEWSLDLKVQGTVAAPRMFGEARLVRGRFTLAGRPFEAQRGAIRFNGAPQEALIDLAATLTSTTLTVTATLTGPVSDPDVALSSTPSLPEDEILPQALFGRAAADLSALEAAQLAASLAEIAGESSLNLTGAARDLVGLDRLDVRESTGGLRVAGGKYLTRDVYIELARTGIGETETQVEWRVRPQLNIVSAFQGAGDSRLSVRWRREY